MKLCSYIYIVKEKFFGSKTSQSLDCEAINKSNDCLFKRSINIMNTALVVSVVLR